MPSSMNTFHVNHAMLIALLGSLECFVILIHICHTVCFMRSAKLRNMNEICGMSKRHFVILGQQFFITTVSDFRKDARNVIDNHSKTLKAS